MEWIVLGSGCFSPTQPGGGEVRNPSGYALRRGRETFLFDFGFGNLRQLARAGLSPESVSHAFITHLHPDHWGDLAALLFHFRYERAPRSKVLTLAGPKGFKEALIRLKSAYRPYLNPRSYGLKVRELETGALVRGPGWTVRARKVPHSARALAYRFEAGGKSAVYSGDTAFSEPLARFASGAGLFVLECTVPSSRPLPGIHLTPPEALRLVELSGCRKALLSHLSHESAREAGRLISSSGRIKIARDLMKVRL